MTTSTTAPFPGLRPFAKTDAPWFFGRTAQIADLRGRLERHRLVAVVGGSGVGKSSLVYAGLMPKLEANAAWQFVDMKPRGAPRNALAQAFVRILAETELVGPEEVDSAPLIDHIRTTLSRSAFGLVDLAREWLPEDGKRTLVLVDQFEEIFRYEPQMGHEAVIDDEAAAFVALLLTAAAAESVPIHVMLTMRADYIGDCIRFDGLPEAISDGQYLVPRLTRDQIESVIRQPVLQAGAAIEHDLVEQLLNDSARQPDALPVLQHVLMRLWEQAGWQRNQGPTVQGRGGPRVLADAASAGKRRLTMDSYADIGGMRDALSRHADSVMEELANGVPGSQAMLIIEQIMRALTEVDHKGRAIRRPIPFCQLVKETGFGRRKIMKVVKAMRAEARSFLRPGPEVKLEDETVIDIGHEALIRLWRKVEDRDALDKDGRPTGWLRAEERDSRIYRSLLEYAEESDRYGGTPLPPGQSSSRLRWWSERPRTDAWARRYGGGWGRVRRLIEWSVATAYPPDPREDTLTSTSASLRDELHEQAEDALTRLGGLCSDEDLAAAKHLVEQARNVRDYEMMGRLAEAVSRRDPKDAKNRLLYAQYLIDTGKATAAIDLLRPLAQRLPTSDPEFAEATGLLGRAYKQIFFDAGDKTGEGAREALKRAILAYRKPYEVDRTNTWHGVNLVALLTRARRLGLRFVPDLNPREIAGAVIATLEATPAEKRDAWFLPALAEASPGSRRLGGHRAQRPGLCRRTRYQGVSDREHLATVHRSVGSGGDG